VDASTLKKSILDASTLVKQEQWVQPLYSRGGWMHPPKAKGNSSGCNHPFMQVVASTMYKNNIMDATMHMNSWLHPQHIKKTTMDATMDMNLWLHPCAPRSRCGCLHGIKIEGEWL
jgi:hypothetical protein